MSERRVARIITRLNVGGPARQVLRLDKALSGLGWETLLLAGSEDSREGRLSEEGVEVTPVDHLRQPVRPIGDIRATNEIARHLRSFRPQIVHTHMAKAGLLGRIAARRSGVPIAVHTFHGHVLDGYFSAAAAWTFRTIEKRMARRTDVLIAVCDQVREDLIAMGIGTEDQWRVIPVGLKLDHLLDNHKTRSEARAALGLPDDGPLIGSVGRLVPIKDHVTLLRSLGFVLAQRPDARVVIAGDGELREQLEKSAASFGDRVLFLGWVNDLATLYAALDIATVTSQREGTPTALIEAAAAGLPAVATDVGGVADVVVENKTGFLAPASDAGALATAYLALMDDPDLSRTMGLAGREWVRHRFTASRLVSDIEALYSELMDRADTLGASGRKGRDK